MKIDVLEPSVYKRVLNVEVPLEDVQKQFEEKINEHSKVIQIKGFRPGKVPRHIIMTRFKDTIMGETVEELINRSFEEACKKNNLVPISQAKIDSVEYGDDKPLKFKAELEVDPPMDLQKYTGLGIKSDTAEVKDTDVDELINDLRDRLASFNKVERANRRQRLRNREAVSGA